MTSELKVAGGLAIHFNLVKDEAKIVSIVLLSSFAIRTFLFPFQGYKVDLSTLSAWFYTAAQYGPRVFYEAAGWCDYPPFNVYIFWIFGSLAKQLSLFGRSGILYIIKLPPNLFDIATAFLIFIFLREKTNFKSSIVATSIYAFNPAIIFNTSVWGQYDAIYTCFLILSLMLILNSKPKLSVIAFTLGILTKPQSVALAPLIIYLIVKKYGWKGLVTAAFASAATVLAVIIPFEWSNPLNFLVDIYLGGYGGYPYTSINAFNLWALAGFWRSDAETFMFLDFFTIGWIMFGALTVLSLYTLHRRLNNSQDDDVLVLFSAFMLFFGFFMLPTRIHERYLFPVFSVLTMILPFLKKTRPLYGILTFTCLFNQVYVLPFLNSDMYVPHWHPLVLSVTLINLTMFLYTVILTVRGVKAEEKPSLA